MMAIRLEPASGRAGSDSDVRLDDGGLLEIDLGVVAGKTRAIRLRSRPPLYALQTSPRAALRAEAASDGAPSSEVERVGASPRRDRLAHPDRPDPAEITLISVGPGMLRGDRWVIHVSARAGARARVSTQAATRIHGAMAGEDTIVTLSLRAEDASCIEYWPEPTILYARAALRQSVALYVEPGATIVFREILVPGRLARGEAFEFERFESKVGGYVLQPAATGVNAAQHAGWHDRAPPRSDIGNRVPHDPSDHGGTLLFCDALRLAGEALRFPAAIGRFGRRPVLGSLLVFATGLPVADLDDQIAAVISAHTGLLAGVTLLPSQAGVVCRVLGLTASDVDRALYAARDVLAEYLPW